MQKELDVSLLSKWKALCIIFDRGAEEYGTEEVRAAKKSWRNDHINLNYENNTSWKEAGQILDSLSTASIQSLYEISRANLKNLDVHHAHRRWIVASIHALMAWLILVAVGISGDQMFRLLSQGDIISIAVILVMVVLLFSYPVLSLYMKFVGRTGQSRWQALELSTCLQTTLALRQSNTDISDSAIVMSE